MIEQNARLEALENFLSCTGNLWLWKYSSALTLEYTNCPNADFFDTIFSISQCKEIILSLSFDNPHHFPIIANDSIGLSWLAAASCINGKPDSIYVLGPTNSATVSESQLALRLQKSNLSVSLQRQLMEELQMIPVVLFQSFLQYGTMLYYAIHGSHINTSDIHILTPETEPEDLDWQSELFHGTWYYEQRLMKLVEDGNLNYKELASKIPMTGKPGIMCADDPLRQAKDGMIIYTALCARAAIRGGLSSEISFTVSDYYIQKIERATKIMEVNELPERITADFVTRVNKCKQRNNFSLAIKNCIDYIELHITEKLEIEGIAEILGYTGYYLSSRFKKETGITLNEYIKEAKIEHAKLLLSNTQKSFGEIAEALNFSSPSFFSSTFRKYAGMSPSQWRDKP